MNADNISVARYRKPSSGIRVMCLYSDENPHITDNIFILYWDTEKRAWFDDADKKMSKEPLLWWPIAVPEEASIFYNGYLECKTTK
jgi:hypothetical protein